MVQHGAVYSQPNQQSINIGDFVLQTQLSAKIEKMAELTSREDTNGSPPFPVKEEMERPIGVLEHILGSIH